MFGQLLPNKNKIATVWRDTYYAKFGSKIWNLNKALFVQHHCLEKKKQGQWSQIKFLQTFFFSLTLMLQSSVLALCACIILWRL
jgi:hypothetical protein